MVPVRSDRNIQSRQESVAEGAQYVLDLFAAPVIEAIGRPRLEQRKQSKASEKIKERLLRRVRAEGYHELLVFGNSDIRVRRPSDQTLVISNELLTMPLNKIMLELYSYLECKEVVMPDAEKSLIAVRTGKWASRRKNDSN